MCIRTKQWTTIQIIIEVILYWNFIYTDKFNKYYAEYEMKYFISLLCSQIVQYTNMNIKIINNVRVIVF